MNHVPEAPQSASGDYAWLGAEPGSVADQLYMSAADEWNQAINSRFVNELLDDTLPESILKSYLIQDFKFFNQGIMAHAIELAPRQETKDMLAKQSQWFADNEATYFTGFLKEYGITLQKEHLCEADVRYVRGIDAHKLNGQTQRRTQKKAKRMSFNG